MYLDYQEYLAVGGSLPLSAFYRYYLRACKIIDNATKCRVQNMEVVPNEVKMLCVELIEHLNKNQQNNEAVASRSQSAGAVSESVSYVTTNKDEQSQIIDDMIYDYLNSVKDDNGTPLLFKGVEWCK